jgi:hypothetical protein
MYPDPHEDKIIQLGGGKGADGAGRHDAAYLPRPAIEGGMRFAFPPYVLLADYFWRWWEFAYTEDFRKSPGGLFSLYIFGNMWKGWIYKRYWRIGKCHFGGSYLIRLVPCNIYSFG